MIALGVVLGDADVLVHVEGLDVLEADLAGLVSLVEEDKLETSLTS